MTKKDIKYLVDGPIENGADDFFGHESISATLKEAIDKWDPKTGSVTIGLFGGWGTGKSGIGKIVESYYKKSRDVKVVEFDIWKYEADSFRRQLLLFLNSSEGLNTKIDDLNRIDKSSSSVEQNFKLDLDKNLVSRLLVFLGLSVAAIFLFLQTDLTANDVETKLVAPVLATGITVVALMQLILPFVIEAIFNTLKNIIKVQEVTITEHRITYGDQFEKLFDQIICAYDASKRIVIIIDNLDRVSDDKILELLSSVKTFLNHPRVAFIIQCDEDAIKRHLLHIYHNTTDEGEDGRIGKQYTDEFLRKFFNTYIKIPPFIGGDLDGYTKKLLDETHLSLTVQDKNELTEVITSAFRYDRNPRKIKQFINALLSNYLLSLERENHANPTLQPAGVVTSNVPMLAKVMLIEQLHADLYITLKTERGLWNLVDTHIVKGSSITDTRLKNILSSKQEDSAYNFLQKTRHVTTTNIFPFIYLKQSATSTKLNTSEEQLTEALQDGEVEKVAKQLSEAKGLSIQVFEDYVLELIREIGTSFTRVHNVVNTFFKATAQIGLTPNDAFRQDITSRISDIRPGHSSPIEGFDIDIVFNQLLPTASESDKERIIDKYLDVFSKLASNEEVQVNLDRNQTLQEITDSMTQKHQYLTRDQVSRFMKEFDENNIVEMGLNSMLFRDEKTVKTFVTNEHLEMLLGSIGPTDAYPEEDGQSRALQMAELLGKSNGLLNQSIVKTFVSKLNDIYSELTENTETDRVTELCKVLLTFFEGQTMPGENIDYETILANLTRLLNLYSDEKTKIALSKTVMLLIDMMTSYEIEPKTDALNAQNLVVQTQEEAVLKEVFTSLKIVEKEGARYDQIRKHLESRATKDLGIYQLLSDLYSPERSKQLMARLIESSGQYSHILDQIKSQNDKTQSEEIAHAIVSRAMRENNDQKLIILETLSKVDFSKNETFVSFMNQSSDLLCTMNNIEIQQKTVKMLIKFKEQKILPEEQLASLAEIILNKLSQQAFDDIKSYSETLLFVSNLPLNDESKEKYAHVLLNKTLNRSLQNNMMETIVSWMNNGGIRYKNNTPAFEHLYNMILPREENERGMIAHELIEEGILNRRSNDEKDYFQRIDNLRRG